MTPAALCGRSLRLFIQRAGVCHRVLERSCLSMSSVAAQMHTSLQQFTDDESMMRDTGLCLLLFLVCSIDRAGAAAMLRWWPSQS